MIYVNVRHTGLCGKILRVGLIHIMRTNMNEKKKEKKSECTRSFLVTTESALESTNNNME